MRHFIISTILIFSISIVHAQIEITEDVQGATLNNGTLTIKLDFQAGGAIGFIAPNSNNTNLVNIHDKGRYIQQSYYAGESLDRTDIGQHPNWSPWPWNPIQSGDVYENIPSIADAGIVNDSVYYLKTSGRLWDMNNEVPQAVMEQWVTFHNENTIRVDVKFTSFRSDSLWNTTIPRHQELPAVYSIGKLNRLVSYEGDDPWTSGALTQRTLYPPPWDYWTPSENWAAFINIYDFGIGVYNEDAELFIGGFSGNILCNGFENNSCTGYISPLRVVEIQKQDSLEYTYYLAVGKIEDIRRSFYEIKGITTFSTSNTAQSNNLSIDPNPCMDLVKIEFPIQDDYHLGIYEPCGQLIVQESVYDAQILDLDLSGLHPGIYFIQVNSLTSKQAYFTKRIIKL